MRYEDVKVLNRDNAYALNQDIENLIKKGYVICAPASCELALSGYKTVKSFTITMGKYAKTEENI